MPDSSFLGAFVVVGIVACSPLEPLEEPAPPFGAPFEQPTRLSMLDHPDALDDDPTLTDDERTIVFNSDRPGTALAHLFVAHREHRDAAFGAPRRIDELVTPGGETTPELSPLGQTLWFSAELPGGEGGFDIWESHRIADGSFGTPSHVPGLNGPAKDDAPAFSRDGREVVFASDRFGVQDLFYASRDSTDLDWSVPQLLGGLRGVGFKGGPSFSADARVLYFHASTPEDPTQLDIYRAHRPDRSAPFEGVERVDALSSPRVDVDPHLTGDGRAIYLSSDRDGSFALYVAQR